MKLTKALILGAALLLVVAVQAQKPNDGKNFVGAKVLFIDHGTPNSVDDLDITNGLEIFYRRNLNSYLALGVPLKAGFINVPEDFNNRNFFSIDGIVRGQLYRRSARVVPYVFSGFGYVSESNGPSNTQIPVGLGADFRIGQNSYLNFQVEYRVSGEPQRDNLQLGFGLNYRLGKIATNDQDGDGVPDVEDVCPELAGKPELKGCPDTDGDGVTDLIDKCPDEAGTADSNGCPDKDGDRIADKDDDCPDVAGTVLGCPDSDGDGVRDSDDACPEEAGTAFLKGCPDSDGDGIVDKDDRCPEDAGPANNFGCPQSQDSDEDGFPDEQDRCPEEAGPVNGCPDGDGDGVADKEDECPEEKGSTENGGCPVEETGTTDSDGDGFPDEQDRCPEEAGPVNGCPDGDGDGVADKDDNCPEEKGVTSNNGCPEEKDSDNDGFNDDQDKCPTEAGPLNGCPDQDNDGVADQEDDCPSIAGSLANNGCPEDSDGDGFNNDVDSCPDIAGAFNGCPDTDGDGVDDSKDNCPNAPGLARNNGCPEIAPSDKVVLEIAMQEVRFQTGSAILRAESNQILEHIVAILDRYPAYHLQIAGHTDNVGDPNLNQILSEDRAKACYSYLIGKGVAPGRLSYIGYGEKEPIADNNRTAGRKLNRRVEFKMFVP